MYLENDIEKLLRERLEEWGFKVFKLKTPGRMGVMDRMILRPKYSPGPPSFVELKREQGNMARLQAAMAVDFRERGAIVHNPCWNHEQVHRLCDELISEVHLDYIQAKGHDEPRIT